MKHYDTIMIDDVQAVKISPKTHNKTKAGHTYDQQIITITRETGKITITLFYNEK